MDVACVEAAASAALEQAAIARARYEEAELRCTQERSTCSHMCCGVLDDVVPAVEQARATALERAARIACAYEAADRGCAAGRGGMVDWGCATDERLQQLKRAAGARDVQITPVWREHRARPSVGGRGRLRREW